MMNIVLRRSSFLGSKRALSAAASSIQTLLHSQFSSAAAAAPANGGVHGEIRHSPALTSRSDLLGMGKVRDFHVKSGPLGFRASSVLRAEFAVDDYRYDEEKMGRGHSSSSSSSSSSDGDEGLEIAKLGIHEEIVSSLSKRGITKLFPIQKAVLQPAMEGRDMFGRARTGTGKTLAFGIPILDRIYQYNAKHGRGRNPLALVMAPTRELARQVEKEFNESGPGLDTICVYGGTPISAQMRQLDYGIDVCVGTPGRIIDLMKRGSLNLSEVQYVVLDEADQMLSVGFVDDIETIFERLPKKRQSMLFSATMPSWIRNLVQNYLKSPLTIDLVGDSDKKLADGITLYAIASDSYSRASVLGPLITEHAKGGKCIVFTDTKREADRLAYAMSRHFRCEALHGDISQSQRERTLSGFRNGHFNILVATDVAARGLDVPNVDLVIHYAIPNSPETFVHRSGRTGRAGKKGTAILIYMEDQTRQVRMFEREIGSRFTQLPKIAADGVGMEMLNDMGGGGRFSTSGNNRDRRFGHSGFGRSGGGDYGSGRYGGNRSSGFGRSDGRGGQYGYNKSQSSFGRAGGFGQSGSADRFGSFGDFGSGRPSGFGESGGSDRSSSFGDFGSGRSSLFGNNNSSHTSSPRGDSHSGRFGGFGGDEANSGRRQF